MKKNGMIRLKECGEYIDHHPTPTCLRNHAFIQEVMAGGGPIHMVTKEAFQDPHLETVGWENFLGMTVGQAVVWASQNIDPNIPILNLQPQNPTLWDLSYMFRSLG